MYYFLAEIASIVLFAGFIALVSYEQRTGRLFLASSRASFDRKIDRGVYVCRHVDILAFLKDTVRSLFGNGLHVVVRMALRVVRFIERRLSNSVHTLHTKFSMYNAPSGHPSVPSKSQFIQSISGYKQKLQKEKKPPELSS